MSSSEISTSEVISLAKIGCFGCADLLLLVLAIAMVVPFKDFYVPWKAKVYGDQRTNVRTGPSTEYETVRQLQVGESVTIVGQTGDWYYLSYNPKQMVREDTMEAIPVEIDMLILYAALQLLNQPQFMLLFFLFWILQLFRSWVRKNLLVELQ